MVGERSGCEWKKSCRLSGELEWKKPSSSLISTNLPQVEVLEQQQKRPMVADTVSQVAIGGRPGAKVGVQPCTASVG